MLQAAQRTQRRLSIFWYYTKSLTQSVPEVEGSQWCQLLTRQCSGAAATSSEITAHDADAIRAQMRTNERRYDAVRLRKAGRTPGILFSLPGNQEMLISMDSKDIGRKVRTLGRRGLTSRVLSLVLERGDPAELQTFRVLPRVVHINSVTDEVENVTFMHCPPERRVRVAVPVEVLGIEIAPGIKRGGYLNLIRKKVKLMCPGDAIPRKFTIDVSDLNLGGRVPLDTLILPQGAVFAEAQLEHPVCKIAGKASRD